MRKILLAMLLTLLVLSCEGRRGVRNADAAPLDTDEALITDQISENSDIGAKWWENISYTREELNEKLDDTGGYYPFGTYFWDEFGSLQDIYGLDSKESEILGYWRAFDGNTTKAYNSYSFYPNRLLRVYFDDLGHFRDEPNRYLRMAVGVWDIRDGKVIATIFFLIAEENQGIIQGEYKYKQSVMETVPYEIEIVDLNSIDPVGYSRRPFNYFELTAEMKDTINLRENTGKDWLMVRYLYYIGILSVTKEYASNFKLVPEMAELGISGMDIMRDQEMFKRYVWGFKP